MFQPRHEDATGGEGGLKLIEASESLDYSVHLLDCGQSQTIITRVLMLAVRRSTLGSKRTLSTSSRSCDLVRTFEDERRGSSGATQASFHDRPKKNCSTSLTTTEL